MPGLRQIVLRNLGIKITSLVLAVAVYAHVYARQDRETVMNLPLVLDSLPAGLAYRGEVPEYLPARVRARGADLLRLRAQPPRVMIHLSEARPGLLQRPVTTSDVVLPEKSEAAIVSLVEPIVLSLQVEPLVSLRRPVAVTLRGAPSSGAVRYGAVRVWPETLSVSGPASVVMSIDSVRTEELDIGGHAESFGASVALVLPKGVRSRTGQVSVRVPIVPVGHQDYGPLEVALPPAWRDSWRLGPETVTVRLSGPRSVLDTIRPSDLRVRVGTEGSPNDGEHVPVEAVLPSSIRTQVRVESLDPATVVLRRRAP